MKKLSDFTQNLHYQRPIVKVVPMDLSDHEAAKRLVTHAARRVIKQHRRELEQLAYK